jgi:hypothetical protein
VNKLRGKVKDAVKNKEKEKQLLIENIKSIKKQLKVKTPLYPIQRQADKLDEKCLT